MTEHHEGTLGLSATTNQPDPADWYQPPLETPGDDDWVWNLPEQIMPLDEEADL